MEAAQLVAWSQGLGDGLELGQGGMLLSPMISLQT